MHAPLVGHSNILVGQAIFWWSLFRDQVNEYIKIKYYRGWGHQNFRNTKVGHSPKPVRNHCFRVYIIYSLLLGWLPRVHHFTSFHSLVTLSVFFPVAIFVLVHCLLLSSPIVLNSFLLGWGITMQPHFHVHIIYYLHNTFIISSSLQDQDAAFIHSSQVLLPD